MGIGTNFGNGKGVHPVEEVSSHQTVAAFAVEVKAGAARNDDSHPRMRGIGIVESFEKNFPVRKFVDFIKNDDRGLL